MRMIHESICETSFGYDIYNARRQEYAVDTTIPFRVSPSPFLLSSDQKKEVHAIGHDITEFLDACDELYHTEDEIRTLLNTGKPEIFLIDSPQQYLFLRPDLVVTPSGFTLCEIETSPFGLALADILNKSYRHDGFETMIGPTDLEENLQMALPTDGTLIYTDHSKSFSGQLSYLADRIFSKNTQHWRAQNITFKDVNEKQNIYRGFYLHEYQSDANVRLLLNSKISQTDTIFPSMTPRMEEKALLALLWDVRYEKILNRRLGDASFHHLRRIIPPTWIVGQEKYFSPGMPGGSGDSVSLASLSKSKRTYVLKDSGFNPNGSWSTGVSFLQEKSQAKAAELLHRVALDHTKLHVVQEFKKAITMPLQYTDTDGVHTMMGRVRLTPYYSNSPNSLGKLLALKATGCENTDYIHATSTSINTAVE